MSNDSNFDSLFTPFSIGKMEIKNRLVMSPMGTYAALMDGSVSDTLATYFEERAKGGVGAIITASQYLTPKLAQGIYGTYFDSKRIIPHLTGMTERIHCYGAKAIAQLSSGTGRNAHPSQCGGVPFSASAVPAVFNPKILCRPLTIEEIKEIILKNGDTLKTRTIILATGAVHQTLGIEGEEKLKGMGVSYCATCDGAFFRNKVTAVVGGGNVALEDAIFLSRMCEKVYLIHRRDEFRGAKILQDEVKKNDKIEILWNTIVTKIDGDEVVERLHIQDVDNHVDKLLDVDGIFIAVGTKPASELLSGKLSTDEKGYIIAGEDGVTNIPGIFAAGDGRSKNLRQVVTAVSDGANCVYSVERYLQNA